jgi:hypothetical protein
LLVFAVVRIPQDGPLLGVIQNTFKEHDFQDHDHCILFRRSHTPQLSIEIARETFCNFSPRLPSTHPHFLCDQLMDKFDQLLFMTGYPERINRVLLNAFKKSRHECVSGSRRQNINFITNKVVWVKMAEKVIQVLLYLFP